MYKKKLPCTETLLELLDYDQKSGALHWRRRGSEHFSSLNRMAIWNAKYAGKQAGTKRIYINIKILGDSFLAHRIAWKMATGLEPKEIDHKNRDKYDNRLENLRDCTHSVNMRNKPIYAISNAGFKYVTWSKKLNKWVVQMSVAGKGQRQVAWERCLLKALIARNAALAANGYDLERNAA